jgi:hypothetical protein
MTSTRPRAYAGTWRTMSSSGFGWSIEGCVKTGRMPYLWKAPSSRWPTFGRGGQILVRSTNITSRPWNLGCPGGNSSIATGANTCGWAFPSRKTRTCLPPTTARSSIPYGGERQATVRRRRRWSPLQNSTLPEWSYNPHNTGSICPVREPALARTWMLRPPERIPSCRSQKVL